MQPIPVLLSVFRAGSISPFPTSPRPPHWLPYFGVPAIDAAVATAESAGATVLMAPENTPYGRIGILTDPFGATFGLHEHLENAPSE